MIDRPEIEGLPTIVTRGGETEVVTPGELGPGKSRPPTASRFGRYVDVEMIGAGGMGRILRAFDPAVGRPVAIKTLHARAADSSSQRARFLREARITGQLEHPNIAPLYEIARTEDGEIYFAMKLVRGRSLDRILADLEDGPDLPRRRRELLGHFVKICDAVDYAHSMGVVHRDLKPANVMVGQFGEVLVMDWGIAKILEGEVVDEAATTETFGLPAGSRVETIDGTIVGTPRYMAPEQAAGDLASIDARTDVYSLGGLLHEIVTLDAPPSGDRLRSEFAAHGGRIASLASPDRPLVPAELEAVIVQAMARRPGDRYSSAGALKADIEAYLEGRVLSAARYSPLGRTIKWCRRHKAVSAAGLTVLVAGLAFAGLRFQEERSRQASRLETIAGARGAVEAADPAGLLARVEAEVESGRRDPIGREPGMATTRRRADLLAEVQGLVEKAGEVHRLLPEDPAAGADLHRALLAAGDLALATGDFNLAEMAYDRAALLGVEDQAAALRRGSVEAARRRVLDWRRRRIDDLLADAAAGRLGTTPADWDYEQARLELASYRDRQTVEVLVARLGELTEELRRAAVAAVLEAGRPDDEEARAGVPEIEGLAAAVDRWVANQCAAGVEAIPAADAARIERALERLAHRVRRTRPDSRLTITWQVVLAERQMAALREGGTRRDLVLAMTCEVLGLLGDPEAAVEALVAYLWSEFDEIRALPAGLALARLGGERAAWAEGECRALVGLASSERRAPRWSASGSWWRTVAVAWRHRSGTRDEEPGDLFARTRLDVDEGRLPKALAELEEALTGIDRQGPSTSGDHRRLRILADLGAYQSLADEARGLATLTRAVDLAEDLWADPTTRSQLESADPPLRDLLVRTLVARASLDHRAEAEARADLDRALELAPSDGAARRVLGALHFRAGRRAEAEEEWTRSISALPRDGRGYALRGGLRWSAGDAEGALSDFDQAVALEPGNSEWAAERIRVLVVLERIEEARRSADRLVATAGDAAAFAARGDVRREMGRLAEAEADYGEALAREPGRIEALRRRGETRILAGDHAGAIADLDRVLSADPADADALHARAIARLRAGDPAGGRIDAERAAGIEPDRPVVQNTLGILRRATGDLEGAGAAYARALALERRAAHAASLGQVLWDLGRHEEAIAAFDRAIEIDASHAPAYESRGTLHHLLGRHEQALTDLGRAIELGADDPVTFSNRGLARLHCGDLEGALADLDRAIEADPTRFESLVGRGEARMAAGDGDGAMVDLERALELRPTSPAANEQLAELWLRAGRADRAAAVLDRAIALDESVARLWMIRGVFRARTGDPGRAIGDLERAVALDPDDQTIRFNLGNALLEAGDVPGAIEVLTVVIDRWGDRAEAWDLRGVARKQQGDLEGSFADATRSIDLDPKDPDALFLRAILLLQAGELDGATDDLDRAIAASPDFLNAYVNRAEAREKKGDLAGAIDDLTTALRLDPTALQCRADRGRLRRLGGDPEGAIEDLTLVLESHPRAAPAYHHRGLALRAAGRIAPALADLERAVEIEPRLWQTWQVLGEIRAAGGDLDGAIAAHESALRHAPPDRRQALSEILEKLRGKR